MPCQVWKAWRLCESQQTPARGAKPRRIESKGHWNVSENVRTNLEKIEELYLHTIEQQKEIETLKNTLNVLLKELEQIKKQQQQ